jgi:dipeptidyl aminopeptidase/acylaminoacyl peptidase
MPIDSSSARLLPLVLCAGLALPALAGCPRRRSPEPAAAVTASADVPADAGLPAAADAGAGTAGSLDAGAAVGPRCLGAAMATLEPHARWLSRFKGSPAADKKPPPRLGTLADVPALPPGQLAFVRAGRIFAVDLPGGAERPLTAGARDSEPLWSPRGTHLAFRRDEKGEGHAYLVSAGGAGLRRLAGAELRGGLAWSGEGRFLAFFTEDDVVVHDLQTDTDRHLPVPAHNSRTQNVGPVFEPGGSRLAFAFDGEVHVADALTGLVERHEWSSRNEVLSLAFSSGALLMAMNAASERPRQTVVKRLLLDHRGKLDLELLPSPMVDAGVTLFAAPRGPRIAFLHVSREDSAERQPDGTYALNPGTWLRTDVRFFAPGPRRRSTDDTSVAARFPEPRFSVGAPTWAPDGRHLGFVLTLQEDPEETEPTAMGIVAVDTDHPAGPPVILACGDTPTWGPPPVPAGSP